MGPTVSRKVKHSDEATWLQSRSELWILGTWDCLLASGQRCFLLSITNASFPPSQDPSVTQLTNAPQGGLAEFNPFSEVGDYVLSLSCAVFWEVVACVLVGGAKVSGARNMAEKEQLWGS